MSFDQALYYPWIDIQNSEWLKTAILYWDKISTIVPIGMENPYQNAESYTLQEEKILEPFTINPDSPAVHSAGTNLSIYLDSNEAKRVLRRSLNSKKVGTNTQPLMRIYAGKLSQEIKQKLLTLPLVYDRGDFLEMDNHTANYYMDLLAVEISDEKKWGLLTDSIPSENLSNKVRRGDSPFINGDFANNQASGLLAKLILQGVKIAPNTPLETLLDFRLKHRDNLILFRNEIDDIKNCIDPTITNLDELTRSIDDVFVRKISPAINELKQGLADSKIEFVRGNLISLLVTAATTGVSALSSGITSISIAGSVAEEVLGFSLSVVSYHRSKMRKLNESPWSYVLAAEQQFRR